MQRILVTGGAGFIGSNFCNENKDQYDIIALDNFFLGSKTNLQDGITIIEGDAGNREDLEKVGPVDYVIHFAGTSSQPMFQGDGFVDGYVNSVQSFVQTMDWARKNGTKKFLYASTSSLYANNPIPLVETQNVTPPNHYAVTKELYEHCSHCYNRVYPEMDIIGFRFMSIYGPNEESKKMYANLITQFVWDIARDLPPVIYGDGTQTRDFTSVQDVVQALGLAITYDKPLGSDVFNIGTGNSTNLNQVVDAINKAFGKNISPKHIENPVKENYVMGQAADISKIQNVLGYEPKVGLEEGIQAQVNHLDMSRIQESSSDQLR